MSTLVRDRKEIGFRLCSMKKWVSQDGRNLNSPHSEAPVEHDEAACFTRGSELNVYGMADAQIEVLTGELLASNMLMS